MAAAHPGYEERGEALMDKAQALETGQAVKTLMIVDDDMPFRTRLAQAMERRGYAVASFDNAPSAIDHVKREGSAFAVVDLRLGEGNGLDVVATIHEMRPETRVVMLTGYGNIATAVAAVKAGAIDYLAKPADADDIERALLAQEDATPEPPEDPMSADRVRWEHIQRVFELCDRNVSDPARRL